MRQKKQLRLFTEEIESILLPLSNTANLMKMIKETLIQYQDELAVEGKNTQPWLLLPLLVCEAISKRYENVIPASVALYFFRVAADILDDVEDADSLQSFSSQYGSAVAINVATTLIILAEKAITRLKEKGVENRTIIHVMDTINSFNTTTCIGQHLDLSHILETTSSEEEYLRIISMKSASQVECACNIGASLATSNQELIESFTKFGHNLGMASQITNDIQGITRRSDISKNKFTLPILFAFVQSDGEVRNKLKRAFSQQSKSASDVEYIKKVLFSSGAIHYALVKSELYKTQALDILSEIETAGISVRQLKSFLE